MRFLSRAEGSPGKIRVVKCLIKVRNEADFLVCQLFFLKNNCLFIEMKSD